MFDESRIGLNKMHAEGIAPVLIRDIDSPCVRCGFKLPNLDLSSNCPECGLPVEVSAVQAIAILEPNWIRDLCSGAAVWWSFMRAMSVTVWFVIIAWVYFKTTDNWVEYGWAALMFCVLIRGVWLTTRAPRLHVLSDHINVARIIARYSCITVVAGLFVLVALWLTGVASAKHATIFVVVSPFGLFGAIGGVAYGIYIQSVAGLYDEFKNDVSNFRVLTASFAAGCVFSAIGFAGVRMTGHDDWTIFYLPGLLAQVFAGGLLLLSPELLIERLDVLRAKSEQCWRRYETATWFRYDTPSFRSGCALTDHEGRS